MKTKLIIILTIILMCSAGNFAQSQKKQATCLITCKVTQLAEWQPRQKQKNKSNFSQISLNPEYPLEIHSNDDFTLLQQTIYEDNHRENLQLNTNRTPLENITTPTGPITWHRHFSFYNPYQLSNIAATHPPRIESAVIRKHLTPPNPSNQITIYTICWNSQN